MIEGKKRSPEELRRFYAEDELPSEYREQSLENFDDGQRVNTELDRDPTLTKGLRERYAAKLRSQFIDLKGAIRDTIEATQGLKGKGRPGENQQRSNQDGLPGGTKTELAQEFEDWLNRRLEQDVFQAVTGDAVVKRRTQQAPVERFMTETYLRGISRAEDEADAAGVPGVQELGASAVRFRQLHRDSLKLIYQRNFSALKGINEAVANDLRRTFVDKMAEGKGARAIASSLNERVDAVGIHRATLLARTETIWAYNEATLNRYQELGLEKVEGKAEFATAGDSRVCPICQSLEGEIYTLDEARGVIPVHPQCRCTWLPVVT